MEKRPRTRNHGVGFLTILKARSLLLAKSAGIAIESHLGNASTYAHGTYQCVPGSTVHFNPVTDNVVILGKDGSFVSGWKLAPGTTQFDNFIKNGVLR